MNLNLPASKITTNVQMSERYTEEMTDPDDDRGEALSWYVRLLVQQEIVRGTSREALYDKLGITKGYLSQIERCPPIGLGLPKLIRFAPVFGYGVGELMERALSWWEDGGRDGALAEQAEALAKKNSKKSAHKSGEHTTVPPPRKRRAE